MEDFRLILSSCVHLVYCESGIETPFLRHSRLRKGVHLVYCESGIETSFPVCSLKSEKLFI